MKNLRNFLNKSKDLLNQSEKISDINARLSRIENELIKINDNPQSDALIQISPREVLIKTFSGVKMYLDINDIGFAAHLALDKIWEENVTNAWISLIEPNDTIFDIGANFGYFGLLAAQRANGAKANIRLFEANPELIPYIDKSIALNLYTDKARSENLAIADKVGRVKLNVLKDYVASSSIHSVEELKGYLKEKMDVNLAKSIQVQSISIDEYCAQNNIDTVNVIKMDIEGYEDLAYVGMHQTVTNNQRLTLFIEFTKAGYKNPKAFYEQMLQDFGNVYIVSDSGLTKPKSTKYEKIIPPEQIWVMLVFSKQNIYTNK